VAKRQFTTEDAVVWVVWDVHPGDLGRVTYDRRATNSSVDSDGSSAKSGRRDDGIVHPELQQGWLCFQAGTEKRRFTPIPPDWHELPDSALRVMLEVATPAPRADGRVARPSATD